MQAIFQRAFESRFKPLDVNPVNAKETQADSVEDEEESDEWSGISSADEEEGNGVQVVDHTAAGATSEKASKAQLRAFMSSRPPSSTNPATTKSEPKLKKPDPDDPLEVAHLKNDMELQKLLHTSNILSTHAPTYSTRTGSVRDTLNTRNKLVDMQMLASGAKTSVFHQKSMPMAHRKGIISKQKMRDERRRAEAKENGVILEKETKKRKVVGKRERSVGGPSIGKFKGGTLTLNKKELASITGGGGGVGSKRAKGRRW